MKRYFIIFILVLLSLAPQCARAQQGGISDIYSQIEKAYGLFGKKPSYTQGGEIPVGGMKLEANLFRDLIIKPFPDNDSVYSVIYREYEGKSNYNRKYVYYLLLINKETADSILYFNLDKNHESNVMLRRDWLDKALVNLGISNRGNRKSNWIYYKPKKVRVGSTGTPGSGHLQYEPFTYKVAQRCAQEQYNPSIKLSGMEVIGFMMFYNMLSKSKATTKSKNTYEEEMYWYYKLQKASGL